MQNYENATNHFSFFRKKPFPFQTLGSGAGRMNQMPWTGCVTCSHRDLYWAQCAFCGELFAADSMNPSRFWDGVESPLDVRCKP